MTHSDLGAVLLPVGDLRLGPVRLSPYGVCATVGVVLAMALAGRLARRVSVAPEAVWDAGLFAVACCFVSSRLLLVLSDPKAFLRYPVLVLSLPSLTIGGLLLAGIAVGIYLWRKRLPLPAVLDTFAAPGALLAAFLELGHWLEGSEIGMPVLRAGDRAVVGFRPVSLYGVGLALALLIALWSVLGKLRIPGHVAALGLALGGVFAFVLDMLSVPLELFSNLALEPGQMVALAAMLSGALLWAFAPRCAEREALTTEFVTRRQEEVR